MGAPDDDRFADDAVEQERTTEPKSVAELAEATVLGEKVENLERMLQALPTEEAILLVTQHLSDIERAMATLPVSQWKAAVACLNYLCMNSTPHEPIVEVLAVLRRHMPGYAAFLFHHSHTFYNTGIIVRLRELAPDGAAELLSCLLPHGLTETLEDLLTPFLGSEHGSLKTAVHQVLAELLEQQGYPRHPFLWTWMQSNHRSPLSAALMHLSQLAALEAWKKGSAGALHDREESGLVHFGRYPLELLQQQHDQYDVTGKRHSLVVTGKECHNGAFNVKKDLLGKLQTDLGEGDMLLRLMECGSKEELVQRLRAFHKKYYLDPEHSKQKISLLLLQAHGSEDGMYFGPQFDDVRLGISDIRGEIGELLDEILAPDAVTILNSCYTGKGDHDGFGHEYSRRLRRPVYATRIDQGARSIRVHGTNPLRVEADFGEYFTRYYSGRGSY